MCARASVRVCVYICLPIYPHSHTHMHALKQAHARTRTHAHALHFAHVVAIWVCVCNDGVYVTMLIDVVARRAVAARGVVTGRGCCVWCCVGCVNGHAPNKPVHSFSVSSLFTCFTCFTCCSTCFTCCFAMLVGALTCFTCRFLCFR